MKLGIVGNGVIVQEILTFIDEIGFDEIYIFLVFVVSDTFLR